MSVNIKPFIIINGTNSNDITGLMITKLPPISKPAMRVEAEEIDGRDGDIVTELGFSAYDKEIEIGLVGAYDVNDVIAFFNTSGQVVFSNEPDFFYRFAIYNAIDFEKLIRFKTATVTFHVQPFKFETNSNDSVHFNPSSFNITNEGNIYSRPELAIQGSGDVGIAVNGSDVLEIALGENRQAIVIDSEAMNAYGTRSNIKNVDVEINPVQDLHGYDAPWIGGAGKNLLKTSGLSLVPPSDTSFSNTTKRTFASNCFCTGLTANNYYQDIVTQYEVSDNYISVTTPASAYAVLIPITGLVVGQTYTLSANATNGKLLAGFWEEDGTYISTTNESTSKVTFVVPNNTHWVGLSFNPTTVNVQATFTNIQLENGSTVTAWTPYENICPITGWDECNLTHTEKNLCKPLTLADSEFFLSVNYRIKRNAIPKSRCIISFVDKDPSISMTGINFGFVDSKYNGTPLESSDYRWVIRNGVMQTEMRNIPDNGDENVFLTGLIAYPRNEATWNTIIAKYDIQIELGTTASSYERYVGETYTEEFEQDGQPLTVFGGTINLTTGLLTITWVIETPTFSSGWTLSGTSNWWKNYTNKARWSRSARSSHFATVTYSTSDRILIANTGFTVLSDLADYQTAQTALGKPIQILYNLAEPIEIQLTAEEIHSFIGENVFWADTGAISDLSYTKGDADISSSGDIVSFEIDARDLIDTVLKNRIVTGNYDNLRLKAGQNQIEVTGDVDVLVLSNFSRWL